MDTSSTFYKHMKQTFSGDAAPVGSAYLHTPAAFSNGPSPGPSPFGPTAGGGHISDIRSRLNQILQAKASGGPSQTQQRPPSGIPVTPDRASQALNSNRMGAAPVAQQPPGSSFTSNPPPPPQSQLFQQPSATIGAPGLPLAPSQQPSPMAARPVPSAAPPIDSPEDMLTADELETLRVVELDDVFSVYATAPSSMPPGTPTGGQAPLPPMQQLSDSCTAKVFPKHVVLAKTLNGAPVVELVIQELSELSEDTDRCSLTFVLAKPTGTALIEVCGRNPVALTAFYKLVCSKRNKIERGGAGPNAQSSR